MSLRTRGGIYHYRFSLGSEEFAETTELEATRANRELALAIEARARLEARQEIERRRAGKVSFVDGIEQFMDQLPEDTVKGRKRAPRTIDRIKNACVPLVAFFSDYDVHELGKEAFDEYKKKRLAVKTHNCNHKRQRTTLSPGTLGVEMNALSLFLTYAVSKGWRTDNPLRGPNKVTSRPSCDAGSDEEEAWHLISHEEERLYFAAISNAEHRDISRLIINQGMRPDEILTLPKQAYSKRWKTLKIIYSKTKAGKRTLPLTAESQEILERRLARHGDYFFQTPDPEYDYEYLLRRPHGRVIRKLGLDFRPYDLRHTFASRMLLETRTDMITLMKLMGHSKLDMLLKYVHPQREHMINAMSAYERTRKDGFAQNDT